jgi:hypothetical protein
VNDAQILLIGGIIGLIAGIVDEYRTQGQSASGWGVIAVSVALILVYFT